MDFDSVYFAYRRSVPVLGDLTWSVPEGVTVLLGPNGAGKSTTLAIAASIREPDRGAVTVGSLAPVGSAGRRKWRRHVGWVPQRTSAIPGMSTMEQVSYAAWLKGAARSQARARALPALASVGLEDRADVPTVHLSGGQLQRLGVACALVHDARVLLLDEPTASLDPTERARFRSLVRDLAPGRTIIISTHQVDDLEGLADSVSVMSKGTIVFQGMVSEFLGRGEPGLPEARRAEDAYARVLGQE